MSALGKQSSLAPARKRTSLPTNKVQTYAVGKRYFRRSGDLHHAEQQRSRRDDTVVEFSRSNPDEEETVMEAQWRIMEALKREHSLWKRLGKWCSSMLQPTSSSSNRLATPILDHILLGSDDNAANREQLYAAGITHICNCATQTQNHYEGEFVYLKLNLLDSVDETIVPHFQVVARFLHRVETLRGRALIHCIAGVSRSATLLIAYLMIHKSMTLLEAYYLLRRKRPCVQPNQSFRLQLAKFELTLLGASSVASTEDTDWNFFAWNEIKSRASISRRA